ncbi:MAG: hypothetical protein V1698_00395 [bacterium]
MILEQQKENLELDSEEKKKEKQLKSVIDGLVVSPEKAEEKDEKIFKIQEEILRTGNGGQKVEKEFKMQNLDFADLLQIDGDEKRLEALVNFAGSDEKKQSEAIEMAERFFEENGDSFLLDRIRDEISSKK